MHQGFQRFNNIIVIPTHYAGRIQTDKQKDRRLDSQAVRQTDNQTDKQPDTHNEIVRWAGKQKGRQIL